MTEPTAFPLCWPEGWPRTAIPTRSRFDPISIVRAHSGVLRELRMLGATHILISSNAIRYKGGDIRAAQRQPEDPGVAVYFHRQGREQVIPCDKWDLVEHNMRAIEKTVEALRGLERWGAKAMLDAAWAGFSALPSGGSEWWNVLGVTRDASLVQITSAYRRLAKQHHPDAGGDPEMFVRVQSAFDQAKRAA